jgi:GIY-YIG catalytic domain
MYYVYLLASGKYGTLYLGATNDLVRRIYEHKTKVIRGFTHDMALTVSFGSNVTMIQPPLCARERAEEMAARLENSFDRRE